MIYIDEITNFIARKGGNEIAIGGMQVSLLLYADDIVLLSEFEHDLQKHIKALDDFCTQRGLIVNLANLGVNVT